MSRTKSKCNGFALTRAARTELRELLPVLPSPASSGAAGQSCPELLLAASPAENSSAHPGERTNTNWGKISVAS